MTIRTIDDLTRDLGSLSGKRVMVRVDFNVPMDSGRVTDATRLDRAVPTVRRLSEAGAKVILLSHFGRPKGQRNEAMSLRPVADAFADALGKPVGFTDDAVGERTARAIAGLQPGDVLLLENTRFHAGEEANDETFARALAENADAFAARFAPMFAAEDYLTGEPYAALAALFARVDSYASGASDRPETEDTLRAAAAATLARLNGENTT